MASNNNNNTAQGGANTTSNQAFNSTPKGFKTAKTPQNNNKRNKSNKSKKSGFKLTRDPRQYALVFFTLLLVYLIVRVIAYPEYYFDVGTLLKSLSEMPTINITSILSLKLGLPSWLFWLEDIVVVLSFIVGALANCVLFFLGFLRFLFLV